MRRFRDHEGNAWVASVAREEGGDYKGRFYLLLKSAGDGDSPPVFLTDVRWNSQRTAERTLATMSGVELRRRLRSALGRGRWAVAAGSPVNDG